MQVIPYCGKRIDANTTKLKNIHKREGRLNKIGLSLHSFGREQNWLSYFSARNMNRLPVIDIKEQTDEAGSP
jgi:hypothetical protein